MGLLEYFSDKSPWISSLIFLMDRVWLAALRSPNVSCGRGRKVAWTTRKAQSTLHDSTRTRFLSIVTLANCSKMSENRDEILMDFQVGNYEAASARRSPLARHQLQRVTLRHLRSCTKFCGFCSIISSPQHLDAATH